MLVTQAPAPTIPATVRAMRFVWTHVRHALQHVAAIGALSPYFAAACESFPVAKVFMLSSVRLLASSTRAPATPAASPERRGWGWPGAPPHPLGRRSTGRPTATAPLTTSVVLNRWMRLRQETCGLAPAVRTRSVVAGHTAAGHRTPQGRTSAEPQGTGYPAGDLLRGRRGVPFCSRNRATGRDVCGATRFGYAESG